MLLKVYFSSHSAVIVGPPVCRSLPLPYTTQHKRTQERGRVGTEAEAQTDVRGGVDGELSVYVIFFRYSRTTDSAFVKKKEKDIPGA